MIKSLSEDVGSVVNLICDCSKLVLDKNVFSEYNYDDVVCLHLADNILGSLNSSILNTFSMYLICYNMEYLGLCKYV